MGSVYKAVALLIETFQSFKYDRIDINFTGQKKLYDTLFFL